MSGGRGWLVTYQHGGRGLLGQGMDVEARAAVMRGQWGWALYAVQECRAGQKLGWYEGEALSVEEWDRLGRHEGSPLAGRGRRSAPGEGTPRE